MIRVAGSFDALGITWGNFLIEIRREWSSTRSMESTENLGHRVHLRERSGVHRILLEMCSAGNVYPLCKPWVIEWSRIPVRWARLARIISSRCTRGRWPVDVGASSSPSSGRSESLGRYNPGLSKEAERMGWSIEIRFRSVRGNKADSFLERKPRREDHRLDRNRCHRGTTRMEWRILETVPDVDAAHGRWMTQAGWLFSWLSSPPTPLGAGCCLRGAKKGRRSWRSPRLSVHPSQLAAIAIRAFLGNRVWNATRQTKCRTRFHRVKLPEIVSGTETLEF